MVLGVVKMGRWEERHPARERRDFVVQVRSLPLLIRHLPLSLRREVRCLSLGVPVRSTPSLCYSLYRLLN